MLKASAGVYHQDISQLVDVGFNQLGAGNELWVLADGKEIESIDSKQVMLGANFNKTKLQNVGKHPTYLKFKQKFISSNKNSAHPFRQWNCT